MAYKQILQEGQRCGRVRVVGCGWIKRVAKRQNEWGKWVEREIRSMQYTLLCECGREFKRQDSTIGAKKDLVDCGCGIGGFDTPRGPVTISGIPLWIRQRLRVYADKYERGNLSRAAAWFGEDLTQDWDWRRWEGERGIELPDWCWKFQIDGWKGGPGHCTHCFTLPLKQIEYLRRVGELYGQGHSRIWCGIAAWKIYSSRMEDEVKAGRLVGEEVKVVSFAGADEV